MMNAHKSKLVLLRLVLGVEMILSSVMFSFFHQWNLIFKNPHHVPYWTFMMAFGGLWMAFSSIVAIQNSEWNLGGEKEIKANDFLNRMAITEFFYCGAVWGGVWWESLLNPHVHFMDVVAPLNVVFIFFLAFKDAGVKRERVALNHEAARQNPARLPANGVADAVRVHPERVRG